MEVPSDQEMIEFENLVKRYHDDLKVQIRETVRDVMREEMPYEGWLSLPQMMNKFGRKKSTIYRWAREGIIASKTIGSATFFKPW